MAFESAFGKRSGSATDWLKPAPTPKSEHHNILHNLLSDAIDTAKGIPFGMVQLAKHPIESVKLMGESYADTYGHGWGHFKSVFMAHPLQPLLDAISVPLLFAGGVGAGVKGASFLAEAGRTVEAADMIADSSRLIAKGKFAEGEALRAKAMRHPKLDSAAQHFRKGTTKTSRLVPVESLPGVELPYAYSSNLFRRAMTRGSMAILEGVAPKGSYFSKEHLGERLLAKERSKRAAATASASKAQAAFLVGAEKADLNPNEAINALGDHFEHALKQGALRVDAKYLEDLAASPRFAGRDPDFQFIYGKDAEAPYVERRSDFTVDSSGQAERTPLIGHPAKDAGVATRDIGLQGWEHEQLLNAIKTEIPARVKTGNKAEKALVEDGHVFIVRKGTGEGLLRDMEDSAKLADRIYKAPVSAWKGVILGLSPRYFVNNVIGNAGMYAAATNPLEFTRGVLDAITSVKGNRAAAKAAREMETTIDSLMLKYLPDDWIHNRAGYLQHGALGVDQTAGVRLKHPLKRAQHAKLYTVTEQVAYRGPQRAALQGALNTDPDFRAIYRQNVRKGMERRAAYEDAANTIFSDKLKAAAMEKRVTDWSGQYYHLNSLEKKITAFVPFYTWDRHALRFGKEQVLSRPVRSIVLAQLGALGDKEAEKELGKIPDFMKGAIPVKGHGAGVLGLILGQNLLGRKKILLSAGYNPLASAADDAAAIAALFGQGPRSPREAIGGQLNPVISGFAAGVTGEKLFSGAQADTHGLGPIGGVWDEAAVQLPHAKLIRQLMGEKPKDTTSKGKPTLYEKDMRQTISSLLGLNERDFSPQAAKSLYDKEHGIKKGRRKAKKKASAMATQLKSNF